MKDFNIKIQELLLFSGKKPSGCETFVYEPSNIEEEILGNLYILGFVKSQKKDFEFLPNLIASIAKREFYKLSQKDSEASFENCLKKVNATLMDLSKEHKTLKRHISFCIINTSANTLRFSMIGKHFIKLLRNGSIVDIGKTKDAKNVFSAVISGSLEPDDKYIFATEKLEELFSKKSIQRILSEDVTSQAETIHNIYEKEAEEIPMPEQAAILIEILDLRKIKKLKSVFGVTKSISAEKIERYEKNTKKPEKKLTKHKEKINSLLPPLMAFLKKKKEFILSLLILIIIISSLSFYIKINNARELTESVALKIEEAKQETEENREKSLNILRDAKNEALNIPYYPFFSTESESLLKQIDILTNETSGVFNVTSMERFGKINGRAFNFTPKFIFENEDNIYVFSDFIDIFYKIKSGDTSGSFLFLDRVPFETERAFEDTGLFYFLNYVSGEVYYFDPKEEQIEKIEDEKELRNLLRIKPSQYNKDFAGINYTMDKNQIVKTENDFQKYFNFLSQIRIRDFVVSADNQHIYLLSEREVFKTENR